MKLNFKTILLLIVIAVFVKAYDTVYLFDKIKTLRFYIDLANVFVVLVVCWFEVRAINGLLNKKISWEKQTGKRLLIQMPITIIITFITIYILLLPLSIFIARESIFKMIDSFHLFAAAVIVAFF